MHMPDDMAWSRVELPLLPLQLSRRAMALSIIPLVLLSSKRLNLSFSEGVGHVYGDFGSKHKWVSCNISFFESWRHSLCQKAILLTVELAFIKLVT